MPGRGCESGPLSTHIPGFPVRQCPSLAPRSLPQTQCAPNLRPDCSSDTRGGLGYPPGASCFPAARAGRFILTAMPGPGRAMACAGRKSRRLGCRGCGRPCAAGLRPTCSGRQVVDDAMAPQPGCYSRPSAEISTEVH